MGGEHAAAFLERLVAADGAVLDLPLLLVVAHPDDEVIMAGTRLPRLSRAHLAYVTDGAPRDMRDAARLGFPTREAYAVARTREAEAGLALLGIGSSRVHRFGLIDQQAVEGVVGLTRAVIELIRDIGPEIILTHAYEGGHPDHDAASLAVHLACRLLRDAGLVAPSVVEFAGYHDPDGSGRIAVLDFLPGGPTPFTAKLNEAEQALKRRLVACHATQAEILRLFPLDRERFRPAPAYDYGFPPHPWPPFYERFVTGLDGVRWRELADGALAEFGVIGPF